MRIELQLSALLLGCGAATPSVISPQPPPSDYPCWPVAAMRVLVLERGRDWVPIAEMQGDGAIYSLKGGSRRFVTRVSNDALLDAHDVPSLTCIHREVDVAGGPAKGRYDAHDAYTEDKLQIVVADDGAVTLTGAEGRMRVEGPVARTRRTAEVLVLAALGRT